MEKTTWLLLALLFLGGCNRAISEIYPDNESERTIPVYIISQGWHTNIAVEKIHLVNHLPDHNNIPEAQILMFSWGDEKYFPHPDPGTGLLLRAALIPTESVLHIVGIDIPVDQYFPTGRIVKIMVHESGVTRLAQFIANYLKYDEQGNPIFAAEGLYQNSAFFESKALYFFPRTSNRWVAQALRRTGYPITPFYALTANNVIKQASKYGQIIQ